MEQHMLKMAASLMYSSGAAPPTPVSY